eukprot:1156744-Pelagomonas_calceolata.AAC.7
MNYVAKENSPNVKNKKTTNAKRTLPISIKEKETHWHRRAVSPIHRKAIKLKVLMRIWRFSGSTRLQNLAVRNNTVFDRASSGNKHVGILDRMGIKGKEKGYKGYK